MKLPKELQSAEVRGKGYRCSPHQGSKQRPQLQHKWSARIQHQHPKRQLTAAEQTGQLPEELQPLGALDAVGERHRRPADHRRKQQHQLQQPGNVSGKL